MKKKNYFYLAALSLAMTFSMGACSDNNDPNRMVAEKIRSTWITVLKTPVHGVTICITLQCC